jgi:hypothetical protein
MTLWSPMPYCHSSMEQPGGVVALHWNGAAVSFSDGRLVAEGCPIPREALDATLHTRRLRERGGGSATTAAEPAGIGRDILPQNVDCCVLSHLLWWHVHSSARMTLITYQAQQLPVRPPPLFLFAVHPGSSISQQWQPALRQWETRPSEDY